MSGQITESNNFISSAPVKGVKTKKPSYSEASEKSNTEQSLKEEPEEEIEKELEVKSKERESLSYEEQSPEVPFTKQLTGPAKPAVELNVHIKTKKQSYSREAVANEKSNTKKSLKEESEEEPERESKVKSKERVALIDEEQSPVVPSIKEPTRLAKPAKPAKLNVPIKTKKQSYSKEAIANGKSNTRQFVKDEPEEDPVKEPKIQSKERQSPIDEEQSPAVPSTKEPTGTAKPARLNVPVKTKKESYLKEAIANEKSNTKQSLKEEPEEEPVKEPKLQSKERQSPIDEEQSPGVPSTKEPYRNS